MSVTDGNDPNAHRLFGGKTHTVAHVISRLQVFDRSNPRLHTHDRRNPFEPPAHFGWIDAQRQNAQPHQIKVSFRQIEKSTGIADVEVAWRHTQSLRLGDDLLE